jgi:hypothetical protein
MLVYCSQGEWEAQRVDLIVAVLQSEEAAEQMVRVGVLSDEMRWFRVGMRKCLVLVLHR